MSFSGARGDPVLSPIQPILEPCLKPGQEDIHSYKPSAFKLPKGRLTVPRLREPPEPTDEMIAGAMSGTLTGFFREGSIFRASDIAQHASAQTAKISLDDLYEYQTRQLFPPTTQTIKSLQNLFYVSLNPVELPSYHFWTAPDEPDPVTTDKPTDWDAEIQKSRPKTAWEMMQSGANEDEDSQDFDDLFDEPPTQPSFKLQELGEATLRDRLGSQQSKRKSSPAVSMADTDDIIKTVSGEKKAPMAKMIPSTPTGMAYVRSLHLPSLVPLDPNGGNPQSQSKPDDKEASAPNPQSGQGRQSSNQKLLIADGTGASNNGSQRADVPAADSKPSKEALKASSILLRFESGAMFLENFGHIRFRDLALYLIKHEKSKAIGEDSQVYLDISVPARSPIMQHIVPRYGRTGSKEFGNSIKPSLGLPDHHYRVRSQSHDSSLPFDNGRPGTLKLTRMGVGYYYLDAVGSWISTDHENQDKNSTKFQNALHFLFGRPNPSNLNDEHHVPKRLTLEINPQYGAIEVETAQGELMSRDLGEIFHEITSSHPVTSRPHESISWQYSAEVFVHEKGETFVHPDIALAGTSQERQDDKAREAGKLNESDLLEEQLVGRKHEIANTTQHTEQARLRTISPTTVPDILQGSGLPSTRPTVLTQSEIEDLQRRVESSEGNEGQITYMTKEYDRLVKRMEDFDNQFGKMKREGSLLNSRVEQLEHDTKDLILERSQLRSKIDELQREALHRAEDVEKLHRTISELKSQALGSTTECDRLQVRLDNLEIQILEITQERDGLRIQIDDPRHRAPVEQPYNQDVVQPLDEPARLQPQAIADAETESRGVSADPKKLLYCRVCVSSVDKLSPRAKIKHAEKCNTTVQDFRLLLPQEAKQMRTTKKDRKGPKASTKGTNSKITRVNDAIEDGQASVDASQPNQQIKSVRKGTKRKHSDQDQQSDHEVQEEQNAPSKKKPKSTVESEQPIVDKTKPSANARSTRSTRAQDRTYRPQPGEAEEPTQPSSSSAAPKRPKRKEKN